MWNDGHTEPGESVWPKVFLEVVLSIREHVNHTGSKLHAYKLDPRCLDRGRSRGFFDRAI